LILNTFKIVFKNSPIIKPNDKKDFKGYYKTI